MDGLFGGPNGDIGGGLGGGVGDGLGGGLSSGIDAGPNGDWPGGADSPASACGLNDLPAIGPAGVDPARAAGEGMILEIGGEYFDLGPGVADTDGDGTADSVTLADDRGLSIYSDINGDGTVDHVTTVLFDGTYETWTASSEAGAYSRGDTPSGVSADSVVKQESPSTWGIYEWERGERGRWA